MRVAVYGGSFDPPHVAHVLAATYVLRMGGFDRVIVVPVFRHAFDKPLSAFEHRVRMCELAMCGLPVDVSRVEERLAPPSYTLHTIEQLARDHPGWALALVVGSDVLHETHKWHRFERLVELAPLFVLGRSGHPHPDAPPAVLPEVSSTEVRELLRQRPPIDPRLRALVPQAVLQHIETHGLYQ
jgi:nicotinate-nucleotide adenylyltransferase